MEVVRDDARERHAEPRVLVARVRLRVGGRRHDGVLPRAPVARGLLAHGYVRIVQQLVVGSDEVAVAHALGDAGPEPLPCLREIPADTVVQPVDLRPACRADRHQHHFRHPIRMLLRVRERERRAPAVAEHEPPLDTEVLAELLDVTDEVRRRVRCEIGGRLARVRGAATRSALVEQDDPVPARVEEPPVGRCATAARSAVQHDRRLARLPHRRSPSRRRCRHPHRASRARRARSAGRGRSRDRLFRGPTAREIQQARGQRCRARHFAARTRTEPAAFDQCVATIRIGIPDDRDETRRPCARRRRPNARDPIRATRDRRGGSRGTSRRRCRRMDGGRSSSAHPVIETRRAAGRRSHGSRPGDRRRNHPRPRA